MSLQMLQVILVLMSRFRLLIYGVVDVVVHVAVNAVVDDVADDAVGFVVDAAEDDCCIG